MYNRFCIKQRTAMRRFLNDKEFSLYRMCFERIP